MTPTVWWLVPSGISKVRHPLNQDLTHSCLERVTSLPGFTPDILKTLPHPIRRNVSTVMTMSHPKPLKGGSQQLEKKFESEAAAQEIFTFQDFPGGPAVKAHAFPQCGGHGLNSWWRKIPHTVEQLSLGTAPIEPTEL